MVTIFEYEYDKSQRNKDYCFSNTTILFLQRTSNVGMKKVFVGYFKGVSVRIKKTTKNSIQKTKNSLNSFRIQYAISNH